MCLFLFKHISEDILTQSVAILFDRIKMICSLKKDYLYLSICQTIKRALYTYLVKFFIWHVQVENILLMLLYKKMCMLFYLDQGKREGGRERRNIIYRFFQRGNQRIFLCTIDLLARLCNNRQTTLLESYLNTSPAHYIAQTMKKERIRRRKKRTWNHYNNRPDRVQL